MSTAAQFIGGERVTTRLAMKMEDSLQAFAVRAACFIGELDVPFSEEFDGHDFGATHVIAYVGEEPVGTARVRWFQSFAMPERLAVIQRFRGHDIGRLILDFCRSLAKGRGCNMLYTKVTQANLGYWEKQGWRRLHREGALLADRRSVALARPVELDWSLPAFEEMGPVALPEEFRLAVPVLSANDTILPEGVASFQ